MNSAIRPPSKTSGFSLIEIAVVLLIISILITIVAIPLTTQLDMQKTADTNKQLEQIKEAVYGFAMANGRLPCPATATSAGVERYCTNASGGCGAETTVLPHGRCVVTVGWVPARTLGLAPVDANGFSVDAWADGSDLHRHRYAVSPYQSPVDKYVLTSVDGIAPAEVARQLGMSSGAVYIARSRVIARLRDFVERMEASEDV